MTVVERTRFDWRGLAYSSGMVPLLGGQRTATSIVAQGIIDAGAFGDAGAGEGDFTKAIAYRPDATNPNDVYKRGSVVVQATSTWTHEETPYLDLATLAYEAVGWVHPIELNDCIRRAQQKVRLQYFWPLGPWLDNDFAASSVSAPHDWDGGKVAISSCTKISTGGVYTQAGQTGPRNLVLLGSGAGNGYTPSSRYQVDPGDVFYHGAIGRVNTAGATGSYVLWDVTHGTALETITFAARAFQHISKTTPIPTGCYQVEARIGNVTASATTEWDCLFGHLTGDDAHNLIIPEYLDKRFMFLGFGPAEYRGHATGQDTVGAMSRVLHDWYEGTHYRPLELEGDASMANLEITRPGGLDSVDYWVHARRPYSDFEALDDEAAVCTADERYFMAAFYAELALVLINKYQENRWRELYAWARENMAVETVVRTAAQPNPVRGRMNISLRGGR